MVKIAILSGSHRGNPLNLLVTIPKISYFCQFLVILSLELFFWQTCYSELGPLVDIWLACTYEASSTVSIKEYQQFYNFWQFDFFGR